MIDPELDHRRIVSGDAAALTGAADTLADVGHDLDDARSRIHEAAATTDWTGPAAGASSVAPSAASIPERVTPPGPAHPRPRRRSPRRRR